MRPALLLAAALLALAGRPAPARAQEPPPFRSPSADAAQADSLRVRMLGEGAGQDEQVELMVEFVEQPLYLARQSGLTAASPATYEARFPSFMADLSSASAGKSGRAAAGPPPVLREAFYRVFFGAKILVSRRMAPAVASLPYVKRVYPDADVQAFLDESVGQIRADQVWSRFGTRGEGVTVAILDSGVDYLHPALGGGLGPEFRVIGGYDFVNDDPDPMDDHGHGTHVAGIVGADSPSLRGVAPGVRFVAFKVLDARGRGQTSHIIRAVERTVDPNLDGDLRDLIPVANVSLGSAFGMPDDPAAVAVNNAVRLGVTFVIAAGNAGSPLPTEGKEHNYYYDGSESVGSPGTAELAITVGSVDGSDRMAASSSRGPVALSFGIKPDLAAPGVEIRSLSVGGGEVVKSGTSMATPHVAGVVALLKALHRDWTPAQLKSAVVHTARDAGHPAMQQGSGRVDALAAAAVRTFVSPATLGFGMDDARETVWTRRDTLRVHNRADGPQQYAVSVTGQRAGVSLTAEPALLAVPAGDSAEVVLTLSVDNRIIPIVPEDIEIYDGAVRLAGTVDTLRLPWAFTRASVLALRFDEPEAAFVGIGPDGAAISYFNSYERSPYNKVRWITPSQAAVYGMEEGPYDLGVLFRGAGAPRFVFRENVPFSGQGGTVEVSASEAVHPVYFDGVDEQGAPLRGRPGAWHLLNVHLRGGLANLIAYAPSGEGPAMYVSPASDDVLIHPVQVVPGIGRDGRLYLPQFATVRGVHGELRFTNAPSAYVRQHVRLHAPPGVPQARLFTEIALGYTLDAHDYLYAVFAEPDTLAARAERLEAEVFLMPPADPRFFVATALHANYSDLGSDAVEISSPYLTALDGRIVTALPSAVLPTVYRSPGGDTLTFGGSPVFVQNRSMNNVNGPNTIHFDPRFLGSHREERYLDYHSGRYAVYDEAGAEIEAGPLRDTRAALQVAPGRYRLEISAGNHYVRGKQASVTLINRFDLAQPVPDAPYFMAVRLLDAAGKPADGFRRGEAARMVFSAKVVGQESGPPVDELTHAYFRRHGAEEWIAAPVRKLLDDAREGAIYEAELAAATGSDSTGVDVRLAVTGRHGNAAELILEPAFAVGAWDGGSGTNTPPGDPAPPPAPLLHPNHPNPFADETTIRFELPRAAFVTLTVHDALGRRVATLASEHREAGRHAVTWGDASAASGLYFYRLSADGRVLTRKMMRVR